MKFKCFAVYDVKAEAFLPPFFMANKGQAIRAFGDACSDSGHAFFKHASDYTLFEIGEFDDSLGQLINHDANIPLGVASEYTSKEN